MSQIKPSPVADFFYETKVGFSFIVGGTRPLTSPRPQSKIEDWWHIPVFDVPMADSLPAIGANAFLF